MNAMPTPGAAAALPDRSEDALDHEDSGSVAANRAWETVTYEKVAHRVDRNLPDVRTRQVASIVFQYQPKVLAKERDRLENPFGFVVTAYRSDPEINTPTPGARP